MTPVNCPDCDFPMIHVCGADHRCERCGFEYVANPVTMALIDAAMCRMSVETWDSFPGFTSHLVDLCSGQYRPDDDWEMDAIDGIAIAGLPNTVREIDIVVWAHNRDYLADMNESMLADELSLDVRAA